MATRQYIGARYVPKFYEGSNGNNWDGSSVPYESLVIVTYLGNSYTSKKAVPIGIDITNTEYWVMTGAYSSQIADVSERVDNIERTLTEKYVFIGDSYADGVGTAQSWCKYAADFLGLTSGVDYYKASMTSVGFYASYQGSTFQTLMENLADSMQPSDRSLVKHIVVGGGFNDKEVNESTLLNKISDFVNSAKLKFPNAHVYVACIGWSSLASEKNKIIKNSLRGYTQCGMAGASYITNSEYLLHDYTLIQEDTTHPTDAGAKYIGYGIGSFLKCGNCEVPSRREIISIAADTSLWSTIDNGIYTRQSGNITSLDPWVLECKLPSAGSLSANYDYPLGTLNSNYVRGGGSTEEYLTFGFGFAEVVNSSSAIVTVPFWLYVTGTDGKTLSLRLGTSGSNTTFTNVTKVILRGISSTYPTLWC